MLGSHNSMSYLPIHGWRKLLKPWTECQSLDLQEQYNKAKVRYFDIRMRLINNEWHLCHNKADLGPFLHWKDYILFFAYKPECHFRFILDVRKRPDDAEEYKDKFLSFIKSLQMDERHPFDSVKVYWEWVEYGAHKIKKYEYHASTNAPWYQYILGTKWFAKHYHEKFSMEYVNDIIKEKRSTLLLDYVEYCKYCK